jgi:2-phosphoglycerate kinase
MAPERDWTILFIGGPACTGKSTLAQGLARQFEVQIIEVDYFWHVLRDAMPDDHAINQLHSDAVWSQPHMLIGHYLEVSNFVCQSIQTVVASLISKRQTAILEGASLLPSFTAQESYGGHAVQRTYSRHDSGALLKALFLIEPDVAEMRRRLSARDAWIFSEPAAEQELFFEMQNDYCLEIARQAETLGLPVLESRPFGTLLDRALDAIHRPNA